MENCFVEDVKIFNEGFYALKFLGNNNSST